MTPYGLLRARLIKLVGEVVDRLIDTLRSIGYGLNDRYDGGELFEALERFEAALNSNQVAEICRHCGLWWSRGGPTSSKWWLAHDRCWGCQRLAQDAAGTLDDWHPVRPRDEAPARQLKLWEHA